MNGANVEKRSKHSELIIELEVQNKRPDTIFRSQFRHLRIASTENRGEPHRIKMTDKTFSSNVVVSRKVTATPQMLNHGLRHGLKTDAYGMPRCRKTIVRVARNGCRIGR